MKRQVEATVSEDEDWSAARRQQNVRARLQYDYLIRRPSHVRCLRGQRIRLSYYSPDSSGWRPDRPSPREWKTDEARFSRKERRDRKRALGHHKRKIWLAQDYHSLEWTTCGSWVLGPPKGTWAQYPRSKKMRQRDARAEKRRWQRSLFFAEVQGLVDNGDSSRFIGLGFYGRKAEGMQFPFSEFFIEPQGEAVFTRRMEHEFTPSYLLVSKEVAAEVLIQDLQVDRWSIVCDLYKKHDGRLDGSLFTNPAGPAVIDSRPGYNFELRVKNVSHRRINFEAALIGTVKL